MLNLSVALLFKMIADEPLYVPYLPLPHHQDRQHPMKEEKGVPFTQLVEVANMEREGLQNQKEKEQASQWADYQARKENIMLKSFLSVKRKRRLRTRKLSRGLQALTEMHLGEGI
ncbi:hypothetical protein NEOLEDRAFT_1180612 [Neolentinus lepideus HHB14362 ss-1]|uniref:Uncharacterized protein n=1 Tax=Neolentinus lepideus HHB14362 ss-1 TaxID=1314782 RepID=A0A165QTT8_9AGAM|nr:hypothetical protein NEOLEDRAFT_1180612 [Neolentinus lepideus HHB14362 ss-1]